MEINMEVRQDITVLNLRGEVSINTSKELEKQINRLLNEGKVSILLNFQDVPYIDSTGLAMLIACLMKAQESGGIIKLANLNRICSKIFSITRLDRSFEIFNNLAQGIESFEVARTSL